MNTRRLATTGVALVAALGLGLTAGCGNQTGADAPAANGNATPATSAPADPLAELTAAALKLNEDSVRVDIESSVVNGGGLMDPRSKAAEMTLDLGSSGGKLRLIMVGDDAYLKTAAISDKWLHMDATTLGASGQFNLMPDGDPGGAKKMLQGVVEVEKTGERAFSGTLDYTKANPGNKEIEALGEKAKAVPFTAKSDAEGRLVELVVDTSVLHPSLGKMTTRYSDFGASVSPQKPPAGETEEAPESLKKAFGG
ncbi:hypothetical protein ACFY2R_21145 [Micromonospora olivasterospora]|uniref:Lipoprotein LprG n=1 Tax=Micromonospora olivasterospora TaxID=1880 RepID=A0A562I6P0_MICOL|nr:hypothetical protein [Micromonospora olivasterospora]TWH66333.1 hypothetical protein JD77_01285 [Micromonospora olivasterospora]